MYTDFRPKRCLLLVLLSCLSIFLSGCGTVKSGISYSRIINRNDFHLQQASVIEIEESYSDSKFVYIKLRLFFSESNRPQQVYAKVDIFEEENDNAGYIRKSSTFELIFEKTFKRISKEFQPDYILGNQMWKEFQYNVIHGLIVDEVNRGISVQTDSGESVYYYDNQLQLQFTSLEKAPPEVSIQKTYTSDEFYQMIHSQLSEYLTGLNTGENGTTYIMNAHTGHENVVPFMFVDVKKKMIVNIQLEKKNNYQVNVLRKSIKMVDQLILNGHILGVLTRPVSSTLKLFSWTKDITYTLLSPKAIALLEQSPPPPVANNPPMDMATWEKDLDAIAKGFKAEGVVDFLIDGEEFFPRLIKLIKSAKKSIHVRIFIFDNDDYAVKIADLLKEKSKEPGMDVKVLLDGIGIVMGEGKMPDTLPSGFIPPNSMKKYLKKDSNIDVRVSSNVWFKADHVKTIVIDEEVGFTGGMNIGREYRYDWHDMMMELRGPVLGNIIYDFDTAWAYASVWGDVGYLKSAMINTKPTIKGGGYLIRLLFTRANYPQIYKAQIEAIRRSQSYIYIHNAYFSDNAILYELIKARRRGVDVRVILPVNGNHNIMNASNMVTANIMFRNGIRVYFYPGMSHIKAAVYDGWLCTGSANFDKLSFRDNLEMNIAISDKEAVQKLVKVLFEEDFNKSTEMTKLIKNSLQARLAEIIANQL